MSVCVLPPPNWVMSVSTGAVLAVLAGEPAQHHARVLAQRPREAGAREELLGFAIVLRRGPGHDLLESDGELVRVERAAFADFLARRGDLVPGFHHVSVSF